MTNFSELLSSYQNIYQIVSKLQRRGVYKEVNTYKVKDKEGNFFKVPIFGRICLKKDKYLYYKKV